MLQQTATANRAWHAGIRSVQISNSTVKQIQRLGVARCVNAATYIHLCCKSGTWPATPSLYVRALYEGTLHADIACYHTVFLADCSRVCAFAWSSVHHQRLMHRSRRMGIPLSLHLYCCTSQSTFFLLLWPNARPVRGADLSAEQI